MAMKSYHSYKDSGIEWLGEIPAHWEVKKLKYVADIKYGLGQPPKKLESGLPFIRATNVERGSINEKDLIYVDPADIPYEREPVLKENDIIVVRSGAYTADSAIIPKKYSGAIAGYDMVVSSWGINPKLLAYKLLSNYFLINQLYLQRLRAAQPHLNAEELGNSFLVLPPLPEQKAIASYLDEKTSQIDTLVRDKKQLITLYQEERTALINQAVTRGMDPEVPMKESGIEWLGEIPAHWEVKKLKYVIKGKLTYGANESAAYDNPNWPRYIRITDFGDDGKLRNETFKSLPPDIASNFRLKDKDILFARSGATVGKTFQYKSNHDEACFAGYLIKASIDSDIGESDFFYYYTKSSSYLEWRNSIFIQATIQNIGADKYGNLQVTVPPLPEQKAIASYLNETTAQIDNLISDTQEEIALLEEYRMALISEVVTGKVDVRGETISI